MAETEEDDDDVEVFDSSIRASGDMAGVFEYVGNTGYFYLYEVTSEESGKVLGAIHIVSGPRDFEESDVAIRWDEPAEQIVGLFIRGQLLAAFDGRD